MVAGNIWVVNNDNIPNCRPLKLKRDNAYPLVEAKATPVNVTTKVTTKEFHAHLRNDVSVKSVLYEPKLASDVNNDNDCVSNALSVLKEILIIFKTGYRVAKINNERNININQVSNFLFISIHSMLLLIFL